MSLDPDALGPIDHSLVARYARRYARSNMLCRVTIVRMGAQAFDPVTGDLLAVEELEIYTGRARIYPINGSEAGWGDEPQHVTSTYVSIPIGDDPLVAQPRVDDVVRVLEARFDPWLVGRSLRVTNAEFGGQWTAVRRLSCSGVQDSGEWAKDD